RDRAFREVDEELVDRESEVLLHDRLDVGEREGANVILESAQLGDDVRRQDVGPRREELAELDERRAELVEHLAEVLAALRRLTVSVHRQIPRAAAGKEVAEAMRVEPVPEAMADGYLGDLRQAAEVAGGRLSHGISVTRAAA